MENLKTFGNLFNMQEERDFLLKYLSTKQIDKLLQSGNTNIDHVKKMICFIQYKELHHLIDALVDRVLMIHEQNGQFLTGMMQLYEDKSVKESVNFTMVNENQMNTKQDKEILNCMKEIVNDMRKLWEENEKLNYVEKSEIKIPKFETVKQNEALTPETVTREIKWLNVEEMTSGINCIEEVLVKMQNLLQNDCNFANNENLVKLIKANEKSCNELINLRNCLVELNCTFLDRVDEILKKSPSDDYLRKSQSSKRDIHFNLDDSDQESDEWYDTDEESESDELNDTDDWYDMDESYDTDKLYNIDDTIDNQNETSLESFIVQLHCLEVTDEFENDKNLKKLIDFCESAWQQWENFTNFYGKIEKLDPELFCQLNSLW